MELGSQFGPEEIRAVAERVAARSQHRTPRPIPGQTVTQPRLPGISPGRRKYPWEQTQEEFSRDPRSWFHARIGLPEIHEPELGPDGEYNGVHAGTLDAAQDRIRHLTSGIGIRMHGREPRPEDGPHVFSARITVPLRHRRAPLEDHGDAWPEHTHDSVYYNDVEDPGSVSAVVSRADDLKTHRSFVADALYAGREVPPKVLYEHNRTGGWAGPQNDPGLSAPSAHPPLYEKKEIQHGMVKQAQQSLWSGPAPTDADGLYKHLVAAHITPPPRGTSLEALEKFHQLRHPETDTRRMFRGVAVSGLVDHTHVMPGDNDAS